MSKNSYSHILKYTGLFGGIECLNIMISLLRNKFVALILGPQGMGLISIFNSTISLVSNSTNLGISMSAVRNISEAYERGEQDKMDNAIRLIRLWSLLTALAGMLTCIVLSPLLNSFSFSWGDHTLHFVCLSPIIALMAITGGETAILKGTRQLRQLARISIYNVIGTLVTSVPLYYWLGDTGIVPSLIIIALTQMILTIGVSFRLYPPRLSFSKTDISEGFGMARLGIAFVLAGIFGSGASFMIRSYLNTSASLDTVGLYNAGYMMTMVYAGMVFSAMETDFFPRLSAVNEQVAKRNMIVNKQIEVSLLLISPLLVGLMVGLPIVLPLLYSAKFMPIMPMMQVTILAMYIRAMKLPMAYITLAKGDSRGYLLLEAIYDVVVVVLTIVGFNLLGLVGSGLAITLTSIADIFVVYGFTHYKYKYCISVSVLKYFIVQFSIGLVALAVASTVTGTVPYWLSGTVLVMASMFISVRILQSKVSLWRKLTERFRRDGSNE